jgi:cellobiose-specific phosphotransferase system component IIC
MEPGLEITLSILGIIIVFSIGYYLMRAGPVFADNSK